MLPIGGREGRSHRLRTSSIVLIVLFLFIASAPVGGTTAKAEQGGHQQVTAIDGCTTINESGRYQLTESIENSTADICIDIRASDVYFDGGGHTIDGTIARPGQLIDYRGPPPERGFGIVLNRNRTATLSNTTIANVTVTDWNIGVLGADVTDTTVRDTTSATNGIGMHLEVAPETTIVNTTASDNGPFGVQLFHAPQSTVQDVTANGNIFSGVELENTSDTTVRNVTATDNGFRGLGILDLPIGTVVENVTVTDNDFSQNGYAGVVVFNTTDSTFANNSVAGTKGTLPQGSSPPVPSAGIIVDEASGNEFVDIDARNQAVWAYVAVNGATNTVEDLRTDAAIVSFEARDVALGPNRTTPPNATRGENPMDADGVTVTNTSANAFIDLRITWGAEEATGRPTNETATVRASQQAPL